MQKIHVKHLPFYVTVLHKKRKTGESSVPEVKGCLLEGAVTLEESLGRDPQPYFIIKQTHHQANTTAQILVLGSSHAGLKDHIVHS
jgi:hypothetical protein